MAPYFIMDAVLTQAWRYKKKAGEYRGKVISKYGLLLKVQRVTLAGISDLMPEENVDILALEHALSELEKTQERKAKVVELRFFGGLTAKEIGQVLNISQKTAEADWYFARAWLRRSLDRSED